MSNAKKTSSHRKLFSVGPNAPFQFTEAYKSLRTNLEFLSASGNCKTILITSSAPEAGKTNVAINLASTLAGSGKRVVLVDCDMRKSVVSHYMRIPRGHAGLTNVITSRDVSTLSTALVRMKETGITILPVGTIPPNPAEPPATPTTEKPVVDDERTRRTPVAPLTAVSMGNVTRRSTSSGAIPPASVMTTTVGALRSGKTSTSVCCTV